MYLDAVAMDQNCGWEYHFIRLTIRVGHIWIFSGIFCTVCWFFDERKLHRSRSQVRKLQTADSFTQSVRGLDKQGSRFHCCYARCFSWTTPLRISGRRPSCVASPYVVVPFLSNSSSVHSLRSEAAVSTLSYITARRRRLPFAKPDSDDRSIGRSTDSVSTQVAPSTEGGSSTRRRGSAMLRRSSCCSFVRSFVGWHRLIRQNECRLSFPPFLSFYSTTKYRSRCRQRW